ncbi:hypothetical protein VTN77DRAFT_2923 [Rasamsonia byssochlamydoides]|uniref:uncharacterized protein n=1 Tax=Rasamsonia byssochlamydoides TaxID=89139 RepID=UPI0037428933
MRSNLVQIALLALGATTAVAGRQAAKPTYFFVFGDSYSTTTFNVNSTQPSPSNPMGNPARVGQGTTGGGVNWVGFLTTTYNSSLLLTYDLAVAGATINNSVATFGYLDMVSQVKTFQSTYSAKPASARWSSGRLSVCFLDCVDHAFQTHDPTSFVPILMDHYATLVEKLYTDGARKFLFINKHAAFVADFNNGVRNLTTQVRQNHTDTTVVLYDSWTFMTKVLDNPTAYGYPNATCNDSDGTSCVWWNNIHPGTKYHQLQAEDMKSYLSSFGAW